MTKPVSALREHLDVKACEVLLRKSNSPITAQLSLLDRASLLLAGQATRVGTPPAKAESKVARLRLALPRTSHAAQSAAQSLSHTGLFGLFGFVPSNIGTVIWRGLTDSGYQVTWQWDDCRQWSNSQWLWLYINRHWVHWELIHAHTRTDVTNVIRRMTDVEHILTKGCTVDFARETYKHTVQSPIYEFTKAAEISGVSGKQIEAIILQLEHERSPLQPTVAPTKAGWFTRLRRWLSGS